MTVIATPTLTDQDEERAADLLGRLSIRVVTSGWPCRRHLGDPGPHAGRHRRGQPAVLDLRSTTPDHRHSGWLPHVNLVRRLPRADLQRAVDVVRHSSFEVVLTGCAADPDQGVIRDIRRNLDQTAVTFAVCRVVSTWRDRGHGQT